MNPQIIQPNNIENLHTSESSPATAPPTTAGGAVGYTSPEHRFSKSKLRILLFSLLLIGVVITVSSVGYATHLANYKTHKGKVTSANRPVKLPTENQKTPESNESHPKIPPRTLPTPSAATPSPVIASPTLDQIVVAINQTLQPYGVTATLSPINSTTTYSTWETLTSSDINKMQQFSSYLTDEFSKYPTNLVINSGLKTIGLVKNLQVSGGPRAAAPAPSITGMLYDVNVLTNSGSAYAREVVSHEYWHYLDYKMQGSYNYADSEWSACNSAGFSYGSGGASAYGGGYNSAFHPQPGLISQYASYAIEEDRGELFGWLIYSPSTVKSLNDSGINCKINRLTAIVQRLSPGMSF